MAYLHGPPVASPAQPAVHDQAAADSLIEDTDHHEVRNGVVDLVDSEHREGVDVVLGYHRDGPVEARVSPEKTVQLLCQRDRMPGPVVRKRHDLAVIDGRAHFHTYSEQPQWLQPTASSVLVGCVLQGCHVLVDQVGYLVPAARVVVRCAEHSRTVQAEQRRCYVPGPLLRLHD